MVYVLIGLLVVFAFFTIWALTKGNSFSTKKEEKPVVLPPKNDDFVPIVEQKPKKVRFKKKEEKIKGESQVVQVFAGEEKEKVKPDDAQEKEKDELYYKYINQQNFAQKNEEDDKLDTCEGSRFDRPAALTEKDVERRAEELKRGNFQATSSTINKNSETSYYGFGVGAGGHSHGSMRDPNFNPWPDEGQDFSRDDGFKSAGSISDYLGPDDDIFDMAAIDRLMAERPQRKSGLGGGSVKSNISQGRRGMSAEDIIISQAIGSRRGINPYGTDGNKN